jgi:FkbM family methyltransferase
MRIPLPGKLQRLVESVKRRHAFLRHVTGVIHVGANTGQERELYEQFGLSVIWVEPIPAVFRKLQENIAGFRRQRAYQYLVTDEDDRQYEFHVADNFGASSSILDLDLHREIWPNVRYTESIAIKSVTLTSLVKREKIDLDGYDALVMDTQGSELLVLKGAEPLLGRFEYIKTEVPDFEAYSGCCKVEDVERFLKGHGFREWHRRSFAAKKQVGSYFDIVYKRQA